MIPVKVLAVRMLANASAAVCKGLGAPKDHPSLGFLTTDCDDATYIALDEATKAADVQVCFGQSFYAGAANASTPLAGEVLGVLAARDPGALRSGMDAALAALAKAAHGGKRGARDLRNVIRRQVENELATEIVARYEIPPSVVEIDANESGNGVTLKYS